MAKNSVRDFDATAANNTDIQSVDIAENCAPSGINNAIRELMADIKNVSTGTIALESPSADSLTVTGDLTVDTNTLYVDSTNNRVGIGTASPSTSGLHVETDTNPVARFSRGSNNTANVNLYYNTTLTGQLGGANAAFQISAVGASTPMQFFANGSERMRIDSSGNVLVGTTDNLPVANNDASGIALRADGNAQFSRSNAATARFNRGNDGEIISFHIGGNSRGTIGATDTGVLNLLQPVTGGALGIGVPDAGLWITAGSQPDVAPVTLSVSGASINDNVMDIGRSNGRFDDVYATNGTIQTSDQNEKQQIASLTSAEITAAKAISKLFKTFKWNDKVTAKGDSARTHAGVIAQDVQQAMTDAGLNAADYAFWCSNTWWESDGETYETQSEAPEGATERTRLGIRYPELLAFVGAATEQRLADIETRLTTLENA